MFLDNFTPSTLAGTGVASTIIVTSAPGVASAAVTLPGGGGVLELNNTGSVAVFVEFGISTPTVTVPTATAGGYGIMPGQCKLIRRPFIGGQGATLVATITASGTGALQIAAGEGN